MATPLRKEEAEFREENITTADMAQGKPPASDIRGPQMVASESSARSAATTAVAGEESSTLFPGEELQGLRSRWKEIQTGFVDEPRKAVEQADGLVASAMKRLAEVFAEERSGLEKQWDRGESVSTEDLRVALQRYRTFFERLLSV